jgi:hypothetical protein
LSIFHLVHIVPYVDYVDRPLSIISSFIPPPSSFPLNPSLK